uniref:Transposase n=1 Tax=Polaromonas sp. E5S TaxID=1840267 RepID=A0A2S1FI39_9BURK|nr:transposase [Polaromonas sp. E5S]
MSKHHSKQFRQQAVKHVSNHPGQSVANTAKMLGVGYSTLDKWIRVHRTSIGVTANAALSTDQQRPRLRVAQCRRLAFRVSMAGRLTPLTGLCSTTLQSHR